MEELVAVEAPARPSGRDGVMASRSPPSPRQRWLLEGAGAAFQHVLTVSTVRYDVDESDHCPIRLRHVAYEPGMIARQAIGGGPRDSIHLRR